MNAKNCSSVPLNMEKNWCKKKSSDHICHLNLPIGNFWRNPKPGMGQQIPGYLDVHEKSSAIRWDQQQKSRQIFQNISVRCENQAIANITNCCRAKCTRCRDQISCQALTLRGWNSAGKQFQEAKQESSWHISNMRKSLETPDFSLLLLSLMAALSLGSSCTQSETRTGSQSEGPSGLQSEEKTV